MSDIELKIGADPEFFLTDKKTGKFVSAYGMIEGTKASPKKVDHGAVQVDGMALEFNIDPVGTVQTFRRNVNAVLEQLREMVPEDYDFTFTSVATFGEKYIEEQPEVAKILGCEPDFDAWSGKANPTPDAKLPFRTASGHIHIGWTEDQDISNPEHIEACQMLVKQLDLWVGAMSVIFDPNPTRRDLYGKAGAYRPKPYGVEYRVPSNFWLKNEKVMDLVFNRTKEAFKTLMRGIAFYNDFQRSDITIPINTSHIKDCLVLSNYVEYDLTIDEAYEISMGRG